MKKFVNSAEYKQLTALAGVVSAALPTEANLGDLLAEDGALIAALAPEPSAEIQPEQRETVLAEFFASVNCEIESDSTAEATFNALTASLATAQGNVETLNSALATAGVTLPEADAEGVFAADAVGDAIQAAVDKKGVQKAAAAGADVDDVPEVDNNSAPQSNAEIASHYATLSGAERTAYFADNKAAILSTLGAK